MSRRVAIIYLFMLVKVKGKLQFAVSSERAGFLQQFLPSTFTITLKNQYALFLAYWFFGRIKYMKEKIK